MHNKSLQADNLRGICIVVSLPLHFTTMQTPHKLRLSEALCCQEIFRESWRKIFTRTESSNTKYSLWRINDQWGDHEFQQFPCNLVGNPL